MAITVNLTITGYTSVLHDKPDPTINPDVDSDAVIAGKRTHKDYATDTNPVFLRERFLDLLRRVGETINVSGNSGNKITNNNRSLVHAACKISDPELALTTVGGSTPNQGYVGDPQARYIQPRWDDWETDITILLDDTIVSAAKLRTIIERAGSWYGLSEGDLVPLNYYGRFDITAWAEVAPS